MSARHVGHGKRQRFRGITAFCPACRSMGAKAHGRLRIEQRARERRALLAQSHDRRIAAAVLRRPNGVRLSKHLRGKAARRNRRNGGEG